MYTEIQGLEGEESRKVDGLRIPQRGSLDIKPRIPHSGDGPVPAFPPPPPNPAHRGVASRK